MESNEHVIEVKVGLYGLEAIYKACYHFLEKFYIHLKGDPQGIVTIHVRPKAKTGSAAITDVVGEIENELLHQALRLKVSNANQKIREYVITQALSSAEGAPVTGSNAPGQAPGKNPGSAPSPMLDEELEREIEKLLAEVEKADPTEDPLKISVPWEEKNAPKSESSPVPKKS